MKIAEKRRKEKKEKTRFSQYLALVLFGVLGRCFGAVLGLPGTLWSSLELAWDPLRALLGSIGTLDGFGLLKIEK